MHDRNLDVSDLERGDDHDGAQVVTCPDCGQMEIWSNEEVRDHGLCRSSHDDCDICAERPGGW